MTNFYLSLLLIFANYLANARDTRATLYNYLKRIIKKLRPTPQPDQPTTRLRRVARWFKRLFAWRWTAPLAIIAVNGCVLASELLRTGPLTRSTVLNIAISVGGIWYTVLNINIVTLWHVQRDTFAIVEGQLNRTIDVLENINKTTDAQHEALRAQSKLIDVMNERADLQEKQLHWLSTKSTHGTLGNQLLVAVKNLLKR